MGKPDPRPLTITPLQFLLALDQVARDARAADAVPELVDEDAVTQPYVQTRGSFVVGAR
jgi:hypothetical protein